LRCPAGALCQSIHDVGGLFDDLAGRRHGFPDVVRAGRGSVDSAGSLPDRLLRIR
jgi:hypothetical protein